MKACLQFGNISLIYSQNEKFFMPAVENIIDILYIE